MQKTEENKLENAYLKFAKSKSEFGTDHIEGAARPDELLPERTDNNSEPIHREEKNSSSEISNSSENISEALDIKRAAKIMIMGWFLNLAGAHINAFLYNLMHKATKIKAKDILLDDADLETSTSHFNVGDSKLMSFLDKIPDMVWGFLSMQYFYMNKIEDAPKTISITDGTNEKGKEEAK